VPVRAVALPKSRAPFPRRFELRCDDAHPVRCEVTFRSSMREQLIDEACAHGANDHGFTSGWYSVERLAAMADAVTA
jgi:hypothetical protein